jgi:hypothetical protein
MSATSKPVETTNSSHTPSRVVVMMGGRPPPARFELLMSSVALGYAPTSSKRRKLVVVEGSRGPPSARASVGDDMKKKVLTVRASAVMVTVECLLTPSVRMMGGAVHPSSGTPPPNWTTSAACVTTVSPSGLTERREAARGVHTGSTPAPVMVSERPVSSSTSSA